MQTKIKFGEPFVGRAGKLMDLAFQTVGIKREEVYISNVVKCRPPQNRNPENDEVASCLNYLRNQVMLVKPRIIVLLRKCGFKKYFGSRIWIDVNQRELDREKGNNVYANMASSSAT